MAVEVCYANFININEGKGIQKDTKKGWPE